MVIYGWNFNLHCSFHGEATLLQQAGPKSCVGFSGSLLRAKGCAAEEDCVNPTREVVGRKRVQSLGLKLSLGRAHRLNIYAVNQFVALIYEGHH